MSRLIDYGHYERKVCAVCGFYWDHLTAQRESMNEFDKLFYLNVQFCPNCHYVNTDIETLDDNSKKDLESKKYEGMFKSFMPRFGLADGKESFPFLAFGKMRENLKDYFTAARAYLVGITIEESIVNDFLASDMYTAEDDAEDISAYKKRIYGFYEDCENCIKKYIAATNDVSGKIFLCGVFKKRNKNEELNSLIGDILKNSKFDKNQVMVLREIKGV